MFIVGLGITQIFDGIAAAAAENLAGNSALAVHSLAFVMDFLASVAVAVFGLLAHKRKAWAFVVGMVLYALDGLLFVMVGDWLSAGFHAFALFGIFGGLSALRKLRAIETHAGAPTPLETT
jgi:hypothetical protein